MTQGRGSTTSTVHDVALRFGYRVLARIKSEQKSLFRTYETYAASLLEIPRRDVQPVARLSRPAPSPNCREDHLGRIEESLVEYALVEGVLMRTAIDPFGARLTLDALGDLHARRWSGSDWADYPAPRCGADGALESVAAYEARGEHSNSWGATGPLRGTRFEEAVAAREAAVAFATTLRVVDGTVWRRCLPPAWGVHPRDYYNPEMVVATVPDLDVPEVAARKRHWKPGSQPVALVEPDVARPSLEAAFGTVRGEIQVLGRLPERDLARDSAYLFSRALAQVGLHWSHMDAETAYSCARLRVTLARYLGASPVQGTLEEIHEAARGVKGTPFEVGARAWLAGERVSRGFREEAEADVAALLM